MKLSLAFRLLGVIAGLIMVSSVDAAENLNSVRARMEQRLGALDALKDRGAAGENNRGSRQRWWPSVVGWGFRPCCAVSKPTPSTLPPLSP